MTLILHYDTSILTSSQHKAKKKLVTLLNKTVQTNTSLTFAPQRLQLCMCNIALSVMNSSSLICCMIYEHEQEQNV